MNKTAVIGMIITAVSAVTAVMLGMNAFSGTFVNTYNTSITQEQMTPILGHVTYVVKDQNDNIKQYLQSDNTVMQRGKGCAVQMLFANKTAAVGGCITPNSGTKTGFNYVAIGNATNPTIAATNVALQTSGGGLPTGGDEIMRRAGTVTLTADSGSGAQAQITLSAFTFSGSGNKTSGTTITDVGLFDGSIKGAGHSNMFAEQSVSVPVASTDSLTVTWTITLN
jgi:hypothetical protein